MNISISSVCAEDEEQFLAAVIRSRSLFKDWVAPPSTPAQFAEHLTKYSTENNFSYLARLQDSSLVGCINVNEIVRGAFQSAFLGYYAFLPHSGQGLMKPALAAVIAIAFDNLALHRLEANIQPSNIASIALVKSLGFRLEGYSPRYLKIAGAWQDHERYAITAEEWLA